MKVAIDVWRKIESWTSESRAVKPKAVLMIGLVIASFSLSACTEDDFRRGGHDILSGMCAKASNCSVNCPEGQGANDYGRCVPSH